MVNRRESPKFESADFPVVESCNGTFRKRSPFRHSSSPQPYRGPAESQKGGADHVQALRGEDEVFQGTCVCFCDLFIRVLKSM